MSTSQARIAFKPRKKICYSAKSKSNAENINVLNTAPNKTLKRRVGDDDVGRHYKSETLNEECSPSKASRIIEMNGDAAISSSEFISTNSEVRIKPLPSREAEIKWLEDFLETHLNSQQSASLYISGQPGTGKTACLSYILQLEKFKRGYIQVYVNCTMVKSAASIYNRICKELQLKTSGTTEKACLSAIEKYLNKEHKMILLVLDEIDQLEGRRQAVLYTVFSWGSEAAARVVLVGVANALDLTQRALPRLQARAALRPRTLHFAPYTKQQIINIFTTMLATGDNANVFSPVALQMLAAKISAISGDMRRALDIGRRVIELAKRSKFAENQCVESMMKDSTVTVELKQVLQVLNDVYGGSSKIQADVDEGLPMQQKLILCTLMLLLTKGKNRDVTIGKLHDVYKRVSESRNIAPLELSELVGACALLESRGAVRVCGAGGARGGGAGGARGGGAGGGAARARRLRLQWDEAELGAALRDSAMLAHIMNETHALRT